MKNIEVNQILFQKSGFPIREKEQFFQVMDSMEEFDTEVTLLNQLFGEAMLGLSSLYFSNQYSSVSSTGYKPSPSLLKYDEEKKQLKFGSSPFIIGPSTEDEEEYEEQRNIQNQVKVLAQRNDMSQEEKVISRFGCTTSIRETAETSKKFREVLKQVLKIAQIKEKMKKKFEKISEQK